MRGALLVGILLVASLPLAATARAAASEVHLSLAPDGYTVTFESPTPLANASISFAGTHPGTSVATASPAPAGDSDSVYTARLPSDATSYTVEGRTFAIHRASSPDALRVVVMADVGSGPDSWRMWALAQKQAPDLILIAGDVSYANGDQQKWDEWFAHVEPLAATVPVMTALGNHETYCSPDGVKLNGCARETFEYLEHFHMPAKDQLYYSFDLGPAHFTSLDTEAYHPSDPTAPSADKAAQNAFLAQSLRDAGGAWNIVFFHRPLYSSNVHEDDVSDPAAKADWQPILDAGGASLVLNGHAHAYERSHPLRGDAVVSSGNTVRAGAGTFYVTTGGGGRSLYTEFTEPPAWSATRTAQYELVVLDITKDDIVGRALRADGSLLDDFAVYRGATPPSLQETRAPSAASAPGHAIPALAPLVAALAVVATARAWRRAR